MFAMSWFIEVIKDNLGIYILSYFRKKIVLISLEYACRICVSFTYIVCIPKF